MNWTKVEPKSETGFPHWVIGDYKIIACKESSGWRFLLVKANPERIDGRDYLGIFNTAEEARQACQT